MLYIQGFRKHTLMKTWMGLMNYLAELFIFNFFNVYLFLRERERQSVNRGGVKR